MKHISITLRVCNEWLSDTFFRGITIVTLPAIRASGMWSEHVFMPISLPEAKSLRCKSAIVPVSVWKTNTNTEGELW